MDNKILYLECTSGISGDMTVGALLDLGADRHVLLSALESLPLDGYRIEIKDVFKSGIRACDFHVILDAAHENHDHDMEYLHGTHPSHTHEGDSAPVPEHSHSAHHHDARNLNDIIGIIRAGKLTESAKALAIRIFEILAKAEASVHGRDIQEVHFHEVGAVDSIIDIAAAAVCLDNLAPDKVIVSPLTEGNGLVRCQHGLIPIPVPAVAAIAVNEKIVLKSSDIEGELVTPTGAAIAAAISSGDTLPGEFRIQKMGFGAGKRDYASSGILRAMLIEPLAHDVHDTILTLETNIDDCSGEALSYTLQQLMDAGALDAFCIPIYMKKNRPAYLLKVICSPADREKLESIIFRNTTTIGIRVQELARTKLERKILAVETPWGMADVKCCTHGNQTYYYPESDSVCKLASSLGIGFPEMYNMIQAYARSRNI